MRDLKYKSSFNVIVFMIVMMTIGGCAAPRALQQKNHIILVGHGSPAKDFPKDRLSEFFRMGMHDHSDEEHKHDDDHEVCASDTGREKGCGGGVGTPSGEVTAT